MRFRDVTLAIEERVQSLLGELTTEEKIGFLSGHQKAVERLGIREASIGTEYARGWSSHEEEWYCTVLPQTIGMASTFDRELIHEAGKVAGRESRAYYNSVNKSLFGFGPTVDLERDPRWGRHEEGYGEDPYLTGEMATAYTKGIVGDGPIKIALPLLKHFICNNTETDRDRYNTDVPERLLQEYYFEVFRKPIVEGGAFGVMTAYNKMNGHPGLLSPINQKYVKDAWGGRLVVSDGGAFGQILSSHGLTKSHGETIALAIKAGANVMLDAEEMVTAAAREALERELLTEADIDRAIYDTLYLRMLLGEFDENAKLPYAELTKEDVNRPCDRALALKMSEEQVILLKNNGLLPLGADALVKKKIAVIGPQAEENFLDWYTGASSYDLTVKDGLVEGFGPEGVEIQCDHGRDTVVLRNVSTGKYLRMEEDGTAVVDADYESAERFEQYDWGFGYVNYKSVRTGKMLQEDSDQIKCTAKDAYMWFVRPILTDHQAEGGVTFTSWNKKNIVMDAENHLYVREEATEAKDIFVIEVESDGDARMEALAQEADVVICAVGNHPLQVGREGYDRESLLLAPRQEQLVRNAAKRNPNTILLMVSSYPYAVDEFDASCAAVLYTTHAGPELGRAVTNILSGKAVPSGRLACTWYGKDFCFPSIFEYDIEKSGMTYLYHTGKVLYPFGYGLSYASFSYSEAKIAEESGKLYMEVEVTNTSSYDAAEVPQVYFRKEESAYSRPLLKLCGFTRVELKAGETKAIRIEIEKHALEVYDTEKEAFVLEEGTYQLLLNRNSRDRIVSCAIMI